ncbi:MAG: hypothetical protein ACLGJB_24860 [Blastocatellia bacterium]
MKGNAPGLGSVVRLSFQSYKEWVALKWLGEIMSLFSWDAYSPGEINDKIQYWVDIWEDLIDNFNNRLYGLDLINPQVLIEEIIDEINFNDLRNNENKGYFRRKLASIISRDPILKPQSYSELFQLKDEFDKASNLYLLQLCQVILDTIRSGKYFAEAYSLLISILQDPNWREKDQGEIAALSQHIIVELLLKGYSLKTIRDIPRNSFDKYAEINGRINTAFPISTRWQDFTRENGFDQEGYNEAVKREIDSLTVDQRLQVIPTFYSVQPKEGYFIFQVEGLKGNADFNIGSVNFYSPQMKRYVTRGDDLTREAELFSATRNSYFINAAVKINYVDKTAAEFQAIEILEKALDLLRCYINVKTTLEIRSEDFVIADSEGRFMGARRSQSDRYESWRWFQSFDLDRNPIESIANGELMALFERVSGFLFSLPDRQTEIEQKLTYSYHWYRKGAEAKNTEDKLVHYWVVIENLLNFRPSKSNVILPTDKSEESKDSIPKEVIPRLFISEFIFDVGYQLYWYIRDLIAGGQLQLPADLVESANLNAELGREVELSLIPFISNLPALTDAIDRRIIKEKCALTQKFYSDKSYASDELKRQMDKIRDDIILIYRYRNRIVHNAQFDPTVLPYFVQKAGKFANTLLARIAYERSINDKITIEQIIVADYVRVNRILDKLKRNAVIDLLNLGF